MEVFAEDQRRIKKKNTEIKGNNGITHLLHIFVFKACNAINAVFHGIKLE